MWDGVGGAANESGAPASRIGFLADGPDAPDKALEPGTWTRQSPPNQRLATGAGIVKLQGVFTAI